MANATQGNTIFVDTTGTVYTGIAEIAEVVLTAAAAAATLVLRDATGGVGTEKLSLSAPANESRVGGRGSRFKVGIHATIGGAGAKAQIILR